MTQTLFILIGVQPLMAPALKIKIRMQKKPKNLICAEKKDRKLMEIRW